MARPAGGRLRHPGGQNRPGTRRPGPGPRVELVGFSLLDRSIDQWRDAVDKCADRGDAVFRRSAGTTRTGSEDAGTVRDEGIVA